MDIIPALVVGLICIVSMLMLGRDHDHDRRGIIYINAEPPELQHEGDGCMTTIVGISFLIVLMIVALTRS